MDRISAISTVAVFATFLALGGQGATDGQAMRMPAEIHLTKTDRLPQIEIAGTAMDDSEGEWMLDCYEAFGPDAVAPDNGELKVCLN